MSRSVGHSRSGSSPVSTCGGSSRLFEGRKPSRKRTSSRHAFSSGDTNVATPRLGGVAHGPAELFERDLLAGDRLHDVGAGDEHVASVSRTMKMKSVIAGL